eukprot:929775-Amphidinium_carterae.1
MASILRSPRLHPLVVGVGHEIERVQWSYKRGVKLPQKHELIDEPPYAHTVATEILTIATPKK